MRTLALAAIIGVGLTAGGIASAERFTDTNGRLTFDAPAGWRVQPRNATGQTAVLAGQTAVLAFNPANDCYFFGLDNPNTANASANATRNTTTQLDASAWVTAASPVRDFFSSGAPSVVTQSVDTSGFWPVQRAELGGSTRPVYGAILARPGVEIRAFCSGAASASAYDSLFASLAHPNDATWQGQASEQAASRAAQEAANAEVAAANAAAAEAAAAQTQAPSRDDRSDPSRPSRDPRQRRN